ncbi:MAG: hypothetical protein JSV91_04330, partial [Phycisphaerales bacterium]
MAGTRLCTMLGPLCAFVASVSLAGNTLGQCTPDFEVIAPGQWTGTTCDAGNDCDLRPSEEHIYEIEILTDGNWVFSLCESSFDTCLYLGTTCCGQELGFADDECGPLSFQSELVVFGLAAGTYYVTIEGYDVSDCGDYVLDVLEYVPVEGCPEDSIFGQIPYGPDAAWDIGISDAGTAEGHLRFDNFTIDGDQDICDLHWWGLMLHYDGQYWSDCPDENPMDFDIRFYTEDRTGAPGDEQCGYLLTVTGVPTGQFYGPFELYRFSTNLNPCCELTAGWISIQGVSETDPDCWFLWVSSPEGDGASWRRENDEMISDELDWAFCLTPASAPVTDDYWVQFDLDGEFIDGGGSGWEDGTWYLYESGWWNTWFYNDPFDWDRHKRVELQFDVDRIDADEPAAITFAINWSTPQWSLTGNPPINPRVPPLPPLSIPEEDDYIVREILVDGPVTDLTHYDLEFVLWWYNPEWVSVDVMGTNISVTDGEITHHCVVGNLPPWDCDPDNGDGTFGDGVVDIDDIFAALANWGPCYCWRCPWDCYPENANGTYGNGVVDIDDIFAILA